MQHTMATKRRSGKRRFGSVRQLASGRYHARYTSPTGEVVAAPMTFPRRADAERFLSAIEADLDRGVWRAPLGERVLVREWAETWLQSMLHIRPTTREKYAWALERYILPSFGSIPVARLRPTDIQAWVAELSRGGLAAGTVRSIFGVLRAMLEVAVDQELLSRNPASRVKAPPERRREMRFLDPHEVHRLSEAIDPRYRSLVLVGCYGGLRFGEMAALKRDRVDLTRGRVQVVEAVRELNNGTLYWGPPKTAAGTRSVALPATVVSALAAHLADKSLSGADNVVFSGPAGGVLRDGLFRSRVWRPAIVHAGLDGFRIHDMRHTAVALAVAAGAHPKAVQERLGHSSITMTLDRYGHLFPSLSDDVATALDRLAQVANAPSNPPRAV